MIIKESKFIKIVKINQMYVKFSILHILTIVYTKLIL